MSEISMLEQYFYEKCEKWT